MPLLGLSAQAVVYLRLRHLVRKTSPDSMTMESVNRSEQLSENLLLLFFPADRHRSRASYLLDNGLLSPSRVQGPAGTLLNSTNFQSTESIPWEQRAN